MSEVTNGSTSDKESGCEKPTEEMTSPQTAETVVDIAAQETNSSVDNVDNVDGDVKEANVDGDVKEAKSIDKDGENYAVFVMNIPLTVSEEDVKKHFEQKVAVKSVSFITAANGKFCGCATVELPDKSAFKGALKLMGSKLDYFSLYVVPHWSMSTTPTSESKNGLKQFKLLVSNISKSTTFQEAKKFFSSAGLYRRFLRKTSRKIGTTEDGLFEADWSANIRVKNLETFTNVLKMDGSVLGGQPIKVEAAVMDAQGAYKKLAEADPEIVMKNLLDSDEEEEEEEEESPFKVFVGNVPTSVNSKQIIEHLSQAGEVVSCWMPDECSTRKRPQIASVTMADEESYKKALELSGSKLEENALKITPFVKGKMREGRIVADAHWLKKPLVVVLSNIPLKTTDTHLKKHFESVGEIVCVRFPKDKTLKAAYMELGNEEAYEKAISLSNTFLGKHCISVLPTTSKLVPKDLLDIAAQKANAKKNTPANQGKNTPANQGKNTPANNKGKASKYNSPNARRKARSNRRKGTRNLQLDAMYIPPLKKMKGSMDYAAYDPYMTSYGSGSGHYNDGWNNAYRSSSFTRPSAHLEEAKRKEIEQVALAALTELEARKSGMNNYYSGSSKSYGSNYSYGSNSSYYY
ncbi:uncharacterized protein [Anabrus simplex]|uniref:uncharacterized protein n=1 Tax=Anabrus simplex TaxID=316456 RepID=UPI0034DD37F2